MVHSTLVDSNNRHEYTRVSNEDNLSFEGCPNCDSEILLVRAGDEKCPKCDYRDVKGKCNSCLADLVKIDEQADEGWEHMPHTIVMGCPNGCDYTKEHRQRYP